MRLKAKHTVTVKLPAKHLRYWFDRIGKHLGTTVVTSSPRTITVMLTDEGLTDLISDCKYYANTSNSDDPDAAAAAQRCLVALRRMEITR